MKLIHEACKSGMYSNALHTGVLRRRHQQRWVGRALTEVSPSSGSPVHLSTRPPGAKSCRMRSAWMKCVTFAAEGLAALLSPAHGRQQSASLMCIRATNSRRSSIVQLEGGEILQLHRQQAQAAGSASEHALGLNKVVQQVDCCYSSQTTNSSPVDAHCARPSGCFSVDTTPTASGLQETHQRKR